MSNKEIIIFQMLEISYIVWQLARYLSCFILEHLFVKCYNILRLIKLSKGATVYMVGD